MGIYFPIVAQITTFPHLNSKYKQNIRGLQGFFYDETLDKSANFAQNSINFGILKQAFDFFDFGFHKNKNHPAQDFVPGDSNFRFSH